MPTSLNIFLLNSVFTKRTNHVIYPALVLIQIGQRLNNLEIKLIHINSERDTGAVSPIKDHLNNIYNMGKTGLF